MTAPKSVLRRFTTPFHPRTGELFVYGGFAAGAFSLLMIYTSGSLFFLFFSTAGLFSAFYFYPLTDTKSAQVGADTRGIYIRRLGHIPWSVIKAFRVQRIAVRSVEKARLQVQLCDNWQDSLQCEVKVSLAQRFMYRIWKKTSGNMLDVKLEHLQDSSSVIERSFVEIWSNRPVSAGKMT